jgi:hypothetical protein
VEVLQRNAFRLVVVDRQGGLGTKSLGEQEAVRSRPGLVELAPSEGGAARSLVAQHVAWARSPAATA